MKLILLNQISQRIYNYSITVLVIDRLDECLFLSFDLNMGMYDNAFELEEGVLLYFSGKAFSSNVYLIRLGNEAVVVDCGMPWMANRLLDYLIDNRLRLEYVFLTHDHFDHVMGLNKLKERMETKVVAHMRSNLGEIRMRGEEVINLFNNRLSLLLLYTGRHRPEHVWYYEKRNRLLFTGDYPFYMRRLEKVRSGVEVDPKIVFPGHGQPARISPQSG